MGPHQRIDLAIERIASAWSSHCVFEPELFRRFDDELRDALAACDPRAVGDTCDRYEQLMIGLRHGM